MSDNNNDLWGSFKGVLKVWNEACGYKKSMKCYVKTWWWNIGAKNVIQKNEEAYIEMKKNPTEETKNKYKR